MSPGWVARRYRIQAAIEALDRQRESGGEPLDLTGLAVDLGYYDAAHFARDFRAVTGATSVELPAGELTRPAGRRLGAGGPRRLGRHRLLFMALRWVSDGSERYCSYSGVSLA